MCCRALVRMGCQLAASVASQGAAVLTYMSVLGASRAERLSWHAQGLKDTLEVPRSSWP